MSNSFVISRKKKKDTENEPSLWFNPYMIAVVILTLLLIGVIVYHFFLSTPVIDQKPAGQNDGFFSFLKTGLFARKTPTDISIEEYDSIGISSDSIKAFAGVKAENFRDKRRIFALQKVEAIRMQNEESRRQIAERNEQRSRGTSLELKEAVEALNDSESLGIMKLESIIQRELSKEEANTEKIDVLIFACQILAENYSKKQMQEKAKDTYLNMLRLLKERAPAEQGQHFDGAIAELQSQPITAGGN
ncbi:MAG: hypothetical protein HQM10_25225 [Candidatus Riflebacteria bacterium]|nr:hypothetical protein [Candidatus Riflebacteria bacterium]